MGEGRRGGRLGKLTGDQMSGPPERLLKSTHVSEERCLKHGCLAVMLQRQVYQVDSASLILSS